MLSRIRQWLQDEYKKSISTDKIIKNFKPEEIDDELRMVIERLYGLSNNISSSDRLSLLWLDKNFGGRQDRPVVFILVEMLACWNIYGALKSSFWEIFGGMSMSNGTKQQYKQFNIDSISDACLTLGMLITGVIVNLEKYKEYAAEAELLLESNVEEYIPAKAYDDINDKLLYRQREILKFLADHRRIVHFRILIYGDCSKKVICQVHSPVEMTQLLFFELLDVRNWTFHNPQSLMVAAKEVAEKILPDEP